MDEYAAYGRVVAVDNWLFTHNGDVFNAELIADGLGLARARLTRLNGGAIAVEALAEGELHPAELAAALEGLNADLECRLYAKLIGGCVVGNESDIRSLRVAVVKALNRG